MGYNTAITFALKRLRVQRGLSLSLAFGLMVVVAITAAIPIYAEGVNQSILDASLATSTGKTARPPFDFVFRYIGSWYGAIDATAYRPLDMYLSEQAGPRIGLPTLGLTRYLATPNLQLHLGGQNLSARNRLDLVKLASYSGIFDHIALVDGRLPSPPDEMGGAIEAIAPLDLANSLDMRVGAVYTLYNPGSGSQPGYRQDITISGLWVATDPKDSFWALYSADAFAKKLLVPEASWWTGVKGLSAPVDEAAWRLSLDGERVNAEAVPGLVAHIAQVQNQAAAIVPQTELESSPVQALRQFRENVQSLVGMLFAFGAPVLGLVFFFLSMMAGIYVRSQRTEIAVLRSRGAPRTWIVGVYAVEWGGLAALDLALGLPLGLLLAALMGRTRSFLDFSNRPDFSPHLSLQACEYGILAALLGVVFCLLQAWWAGQDTLVSYKQERARSRRRPAWQRFYLDFACLLPVLYGLYTLHIQGRLTLLGRSLGSADPFQNPFLFLLPVLLIVGLSLLFLRLMPPLLDGLAALAARFPGITLPYVLRQLARSGGSYQSVLLLAAFTLGLAIFVSSEANSLDRTLAESLKYASGADLNLSEGGDFSPDKAMGQGVSGQGIWNFLPVSEHLSLPGVRSAARVGRYPAEFSSGERSAGGILLGIDRSDFAQTAFFRTDFASEPFFALLNRLASSPDAVLVDQHTWARFNLVIGATLPLRLTLNGQTILVNLRVAGTFTRFPTWYPDTDGALFVTNLDPLFEALGSVQPYEVWLSKTPGASTGTIVDSINRMGVEVVTVKDAQAQLQAALTSPARQGTQGLLSVGFLSAAVLTVLGIGLYLLFSYRERLVQMGVLRAIGLKVRGMRWILAGETAVLAMLGIGLGTLVGSVAAESIIPALPVVIIDGVEALPQIGGLAWGNILAMDAIFCGALFLGAFALLSALDQTKIFQVIKMGESI